MQDTIIAYKLNQTTINMLENITSKVSKDINIYYTDIPEDIVGVPAFMIFADLEKETEENKKYVIKCIDFIKNYINCIIVDKMTFNDEVELGIRIKDTYINYNTVMKTGIKELDKIINIQEPNLIILNGKAGTGKTTLIEKILYNVAVGQKSDTLFFSLENSQEKIITDILKSIAHIKNSKITNTQFTKEDCKKLSIVIPRLLNSHILIDDTPAVTTDYIDKQIEKASAIYDVRFVAIDYLQLLKTQENEKVALKDKATKVLKHLKELTFKYNITIFINSCISSIAQNNTEDSIKVSNNYIRKDIVEYADIVLALDDNKQISVVKK